MLNIAWFPSWHAYSNISSGCVFRLSAAVHDLANVRRRFNGSGREQIHGHAAIPNRPMHRAARRLIPLGEQRFDLIVGPVDRSGTPRFVIAFAAEFERRLGERRVAGFVRNGSRMR